MSIPDVDGTPVVVEGTPVRLAAASAANGHSLDAAANAFRDRLRGIQNEEQARFERSVDRAARRSLELQRAELARSVQVELGPALRSYLADAPQTSHLVDELTMALSRRVEADASGVVRRLASREAATHELSRALERQCLQRVDERVSSFWTGVALGGVATALAGVAAGWASGWAVGRAAGREARC